MASLAPFVSSPQEVVAKMLEIVEAERGDTLYDIGSGDGRILITAVQQFGVSRAVGVELRQDLVKRARDAIAENGLADRIRILHKNVFEIDVSDADIITLYLTTSGNNKLKPKLERELKHEARIISHDFSFSDWKPTSVESFGGHTLYLYKMADVLAKQAHRSEDET